MRRNSKKAIAAIFSATAAVSVFQASAVKAATYNWNVPTGDFDTATNWNPNGIPGAADTADVNNAGTATFSAADTLTIANVFAGDTTGVGHILQTGGTLTIPNNGSLLVGANGGTGTYSMTGASTINSTGTIQLFGNAATDPTGALTTMTIGTGATLTNSSMLSVGYSANSAQGQTPTIDGAATLTISGGTLNENGTLAIGTGQNAVGNLIVSGGTLNLGQGDDELWVGDSGDSTNHVGGSGIFTMTGGTVITHTWAAIGRGGSSTGVFNLNGGTFIHTGGNGDFEISSYGEDNHTGNNGTLNLNGGVLEVDHIRNESPSGATQTINFNGSNIQPNTSDGGFIGGHGNFTALNVQQGGVIFTLSAPTSLDYTAPGSTGYDVGVTQTLIGSTGDGGVNVTGPGSLTLSASNSWNGPTIVNNAILQVNNDSGLGNQLVIHLNNGGTIQNFNDNGNGANPSFVLSGSRSIILSGSAYLRPGWQGFQNNAPISGTGNFGVVFDSGILTLASSDSYTGSTTVGATGNSGFYDGGLDNVPYFGVRLANANALPAGTNLIFGVDPNNTASSFHVTMDMNGISSTVGTLTGTSAGAQILNSNAGTTSTLTIGSNTGNGSTITSATVSTYAGSILDVASNSSYGTIAVNKIGPGTEIVTGTLKYSGATTLTGGKLYVNGSSSSSAITANAGTTLGGSGTINGAVTIASSASLEGGYLGLGTLNSTAGVTLNSGSAVVVGNLSNYANGSSGVPAINVSGGALGVNGTVSVNVNEMTGTIPANSTFDVLNYTSTTGAGTFAVGTLADRATGYITNTGSEVLLTITGTDYIVWSGAHGSAWDTSTQNFIDNATSLATTYEEPGDSVVFPDVASTYSVNLGSLVVHPSNVTFSNTSAAGHAYTLSGTGGIAGPTGVTINGGGVVNLDTSNTYLGATLVQSGTLAVGTGGSLSSATPVTLGNAVTNTSGVLQIGDTTGAVNLSIGSLAIAGSGTGNAIIGGNASAVSTLTITAAGSNSYPESFGASGNATANNFALALTGGGTSTLSGTSTYTGGTTFGGGTLIITNSGALGTGPVTFTGNSTVQPTTSVTLTNNMSLGSTTEVFDTGTGNTVTLSGSLTNVTNNGIVLRPIGSGTFNLSGSLNLAGNSGNTDDPVLMINSNGLTVNITGTGSIGSVSMGYNGTYNTLNLNPTNANGSAGTLNITDPDFDLLVGQGGSNDAGQINQTGGTVNLSGNIHLGQWDNSFGGYLMQAGTLNFANLYASDRNSHSSNFTQTGGTVNVSGQTNIGQTNVGVVSNFYLTGGTFNNSGSNPTNGAFQIAPGGGSVGYATVAGGTLNVGGQEITLGGGGTGTTAVLNLNGGTTIVNNIQSTNSASTSIVNLNGGILQASNNSGFFLGGLTGNLTSANVYSGGAIFNTSGQGVTVSQGLLAMGGTTGVGAVGTVIPVTGATGYIGAPLVQVSGTGTGATAVATYNASNKQVTGITITNPGTGYSGTPTFNLVGGAGSSAAINGTTAVNNPDGGLTKIGAGSLTLSGSSSYTGGTKVQAGTVVVANNNALGTGAATLSPSTTLSLAFVPQYVNFLTDPNSYTSVAGNRTNGYKPVVSADGHTAQMTTTALNIADSLYESNELAFTGNFVANFTYTHTNVGGYQTAADGVNLTIQPNSGINVGYVGGQDGYGTPIGVTPIQIPNSVAAGVDEFNDKIESGVYGVFNTSSTTLTPADPTDPSSNSVPFISESASSNITVVYNAAAETLTEIITSNTNGASYTLVTPNVNLSTILGNNDAGNGPGAYIGFTASTGGLGDNQYISNFSFNNAGLTIANGLVIANPVVVPIGAATLQLAGSPVFSSGSVGTLNVGTGGTLNITASTAGGATHGALVTPSLNLSSGATVNLNNNALDITAQVAGSSPTSFAAVQAMVKSGYASGNWNGSGISSAAAAGDTTHLTAIGVILNSVDGTPTGAALYNSTNQFDGITPLSNTDILVKYTYYGDTNLDGQVDGTDYSRIDAAFVADQKTPGSLTGWYNGDFNYDGVVDGSDYTLMDNAYNRQGLNIDATGNPEAEVTDQIAGLATPGSVSAVPEPTTLGLLAIGAAGLLGRRRRRHH